MVRYFISQNAGTIALIAIAIVVTLVSLPWIVQIWRCYRPATLARRAAVAAIIESPEYSIMAIGSERIVAHDSSAYLLRDRRGKWHDRGKFTSAPSFESPISGRIGETRIG